MVEAITMVIYSTIYCYITFYMSGQYNEDHRFLKYFYTVIVVLLCTQSLSSSIGIVLQKNSHLALFTSILVTSLLFMCTDFVFRVDDMPIPLKLISELSFPRFMFTSVMIVIYGLNRCQSHQMSYVLRQFNYNNVENIFCQSTVRLIVILVVLKIIELVLFWIKTSRLKCESNYIRNLLNRINFRSKSKDNNNYMVSIDMTENNNSTSEEQSNEIMLVWKNLCHKVKKFFNGDVNILNNLNGFITVGSLNAVMGPSGAGKTTLIECLMSNNADRDSRILVNPKALRKTCLIKQYDNYYLNKDLTVWQTLIYASRLKNSNECGSVDHQLIVTALLNDLLISDVKHTKVGDCSGGQQKRVVIACELTACVRPDLLCIDEPTTGLDSTSARMVVVLTKTLIKNFYDSYRGHIGVYNFVDLPHAETQIASAHSRPQARNP